MGKLEDYVKTYKNYHGGNSQRKLFEEQAKHKVKLYDATTHHLKQHHGVDSDHPGLSNLQDIEDPDEREYQARQFVHKLASYGLEEVMGDKHAFFDKEAGPKDKTKEPGDDGEHPKLDELHIKAGHESMLNAFLEEYLGASYEGLVQFMVNNEVDFVNEFFDESSQFGRLMTGYSKNLTEPQRQYQHANLQISKLRDKPGKLVDLANPFLEPLGLKVKTSNFSVSRLTDLLEAHGKGKKAFKNFIDDHENWFDNL